MFLPRLVAPHWGMLGQLLWFLVICYTKYSYLRRICNDCVNSKCKDYQIKDIHAASPVEAKVVFCLYFCHGGGGRYIASLCPIRLWIARCRTLWKYLSVQIVFPALFIFICVSKLDLSLYALKQINWFSAWFSGHIYQIIYSTYSMNILCIIHI